ncbi:MAG: trypsin-like peptidase domain-containing protein [Phycisphaerales bacterium]|nr:trypsin-like peptidase domain-containing protein [Planctomycetota bacterium]MCH8507933.1 trypsin-like peptidase domain-containing protein [Phycisphaerales bacterium]
MRQFQSLVPLLMVIVVGVLLVVGGPRLLRHYTLAEQSARIVLARGVLESDDILRRIDRAVTAIADSVSPSVVHLDTTGDRRFMSGSSGAGWVYDDQGHIVTNAHVVRDSRRIMVEFSDGVVASGTLVGSDVYTDIAVILVDRPGSQLFPAVRSPIRLPRVGERVFAFGSPFGFKFSMSEGIVSGLGRQAPGSSIPGGYTNYIQTDAAVNPGNSGGPLVNTDGHVVGMNVAIATSRSLGASPNEAGGDSAGISFAIPLGTIEPIVEQLIRFGSVSRGYMGITFGREGGIDRVTTEQGRVLTGIRVDAVEDGGPSQRAGIRRNDVIVSIQGSPILNTESLSSLVSSSRPGDTVEVGVWRDGELLDLSVTLDRIRNEVLAQRLYRPTQMRLGALIRSDDGQGVRISEVWEGMPAWNAGLRVGDRIVRVDNKEVRGLDDFYVTAADAGLLTGMGVRMTVVGEDGEQREIRVNLSPS